MVFKKQINKNGLYVDNKGVRFNVLSCERTEELEIYPTGEVDEYGNPIMAKRIVVNKGWDSFEDINEAIEYYQKNIDKKPVFD